MKSVEDNNISALERLAIKLEVQNEEAQRRLQEQRDAIEKFAELLRQLKAQDIKAQVIKSND